MKEAYRLNKPLQEFSSIQPALLIAYIYTGKEKLDFHALESKLKKSLKRLIKETLSST